MFYWILRYQKWFAFAQHLGVRVYNSTILIERDQNSHPTNYFHVDLFILAIQSSTINWANHLRYKLASRKAKTPDWLLFLIGVFHDMKILGENGKTESRIQMFDLPVAK